MQVENQQFSSYRTKSRSSELRGHFATPTQLCTSLAGLEQAGTRTEPAKLLIESVRSAQYENSPTLPFPCSAEQFLQPWDCSDCCRREMGSSQILAPAIFFLKHFWLPFKGLAWGHSLSLLSHLLIAWVGGRGEAFNPEHFCPFSWVAAGAIGD